MEKKLVAVFSPTGRTLQAARELAAAEHASLFEIRPATPYSAADLDWTNSNSRTSLEEKDAGCRPVLAEETAPVKESQVIFLGFPIWWYTCPRIIHSFLESYDFAGKTVIPFATSGGSTLDRAEAEIRAALPQARVLSGLLMNRHYSEQQLKEWAEHLN